MKNYEELASAADNRIERERFFWKSSETALLLLLDNIFEEIRIPKDTINNKEYGYIERLVIEKSTMDATKRGLHAVFVCTFGYTCVKQEVTCLPLENESFLFTVNRATAVATLEDLKKMRATEVVDMFSEEIFKRLTGAPFSD